MASPFFANFIRILFEEHPLSSNAFSFGTPPPLYVEETLDAFRALFRHFCYGLGNDLSLPKGAFYASSSSVGVLGCGFDLRGVF